MQALKLLGTRILSWNRLTRLTLEPSKGTACAARVCSGQWAGTATRLLRQTGGHCHAFYSRQCHVSAVPRGKILAGRSIYRRRLLPTVSTRPRTPASTLMPDEEDGRHVFNAGPDLSDAEMTDGCESPILSVVRPIATSNTSHDIFDEHGRRFYRPILDSSA